MTVSRVQFTATDFMSMAAKTSGRGDNMSEANLQADGLVKGQPKEQRTGRREEEDSSPHNSPTWSPVQRPPAGCLNMNYCLEIQVTLTDELGDLPHTCMLGQHQWWRDMLQEARAGLREAVVIGQVGQYFFMGEHFHGRGSKGG